VDGVLVGGASLKVEEFAIIIKRSTEYLAARCLADETSDHDCVRNSVLCAFAAYNPTRAKGGRFGSNCGSASMFHGASQEVSCSTNLS